MQGISFLGIVITAAKMYNGMESAVSVSVGVLMFYLITGPVGLMLAYRGLGLRVTRTFDVFFVPMVAGGIGAAAGLYVVDLLPGNGWTYAILQAAAGTVTVAGIYILLLWVMKPALLSETLALFKDLIVDRVIRVLRRG